MSDGLSDSRKMIQASERKRMLFHSLETFLKDQANLGKRIDAVNDVIAHQAYLYDVDETADREATASGFVGSLLAGDDKAWAQVLAYALRDCGSTISQREFADLKDLSPFKGKTLVIAHTTDFGTRLQSVQDLVTAIEKQSAKRTRHPTDDRTLIALDISLISATEVKV